LTMSFYPKASHPAPAPGRYDPPDETARDEYRRRPAPPVCAECEELRHRLRLLADVVATLAGGDK